MKRSSRSSRGFAFGAAALFVSLSACSILSGGDDSSAAANADAGDDTDNGRRDASTRHDSGSSSDARASADDSGNLKHDDAGHVIGDDGGPLMCEPQPLGSFSGGSYAPPIGPYAGQCNATDFANFLSCANATDTSQCAQFAAGGARATCGACMLTPKSASHWGPALGTDPATSLLNGAGCLALAFGEGSSTTGCGGKEQRAENCIDTACDPTFNCAGASSTDLQTCQSSAQSGSCASYINAGQTACAKDAGGLDAVCSPPDEPSLESFLNFFCGTDPGAG